MTRSFCVGHIYMLGLSFDHLRAQIIVTRQELLSWFRLNDMLLVQEVYRS
jgi:hypothetical protein